MAIALRVVGPATLASARRAPYLVSLGAAFAVLALVTVPATCAEPAPTVQFFGDSITLMETDALLAALPGVEVRAANGARVGALILGRATLEGPWPSEVKAPVAVLAYGANDSAVWLRTPIPDFKDRFRRMVATAPARMILETPLPTTTAERPTDAYAVAIREVAAELGLQVIDSHACFLRMPEWQRHLPDGVHPDDEAVRYLVDVCIVPALRR